jgi:hypothetical protein
MKPLRVGAYFIGAAVVGAGIVLGLTNPSPTAYGDYATVRLSKHLKENVCPQAPGILGGLLGNACVSLVDDNQDRIRMIITQNTERQNFVILSIYRTELSANQLLSENWADGPLPEYQFETVGVFQRFFTYRAERQR